LPKAACGFANAPGGVIIIGIEAKRPHGENKVDVVTELKPVADVEAVKSAPLQALLDYVVPGIEGVRSTVVNSGEADVSGFVLLYIPESVGTPHRSNVTKEFYVQITTGTVPNGISR
jgi:predicted HTH transcriptional regulator